MARGFNIKKYSNKAQQLVEFALIAPIILGLIIFIIELGYSINIRSQLTDAVRVSIAEASRIYNGQFSDTSSKMASFEQGLEEEIKNYIINHGLPFEDSVDVELVGISGANKTAVLLKYKYSPFFTLPFGIVPNSYQFVTTQIVSNSLLKANDHGSNFMMNDLGSFWKDSGDLDGRRGILKNDPNISGISSEDAKKSIAFLVAFALPYTAEASINSDTFARLVNWWGQDLLPQNLFLNITTGNLVVYSPYYSTQMFDTNIPFAWVLSSLGFSHGIYTKMFVVPGHLGEKLDFTSTTLNSGYIWCDQGSTGDCDDDMSDSASVNQLKSALGINYSSIVMADGSYDEVSVHSSGFFVTTSSKPHSFYDSGNDQFLKLYVPNTNFPDINDNLYQFDIGLDGSGRYVSGSTTDIVDCYMDNDGDGIPNAWDDHQTYFDADADGIIDGKETSNISLIDWIIPSGSVGSFYVGKNGNSGTLCNGGPNYNWEYRITAAPVDDASFYSMLPKDVSNNLNSPAKTYIPDFDSSNKLAKVTYQLTTRSAPSCNANVSTVQAYYLKYNGNTQMTRLLNDWTLGSEILEKANFINGTVSGSTINVQRSKELDLLESDAFANKVTN